MIAWISGMVVVIVCDALAQKELSLPRQTRSVNIVVAPAKEDNQ